MFGMPLGARWAAGAGKLSAALSGLTRGGSESRGSLRSPLAELCRRFATNIRL